MSKLLGADLLGTDQLEEIFRILDFDGSGGVGIDEFFDNISKLVTGQVSLSDMRTQQKISSAATGINERINDVDERIDYLLQASRHQGELLAKQGELLAEIRYAGNFKPTGSLQTALLERV